MRNGRINPDDDEVIVKIASTLENIFGKPKIDEIIESWDTLHEMTRKKNDPIEPFMLKFDTAEAGLSALDCPVDQKILTLMLLKAINVDKSEKRTIISNMNFESQSLYDDLKTSIRLNKGALVEGFKQKPVEDDEKKSAEGEVFYGDSWRQGNFQQNFRGRTKSDSFRRQQQR